MSPGTGKVCKVGIYTLPGFCHQCYVGVARVEGDWKTRGWDSNYILYCREDVHPTLQRSVCNCLTMIVGSSYIIQGVHYPHRSANQCVPLHNRGRANLCLGRVQPVHNISAWLHLSWTFFITVRGWLTSSRSLSSCFQASTAWPMKQLSL